tara:strand:+ start:66 stop:815 length:750 start_codon:yes stop_codon:yes gene_type:complete
MESEFSQDLGAAPKLAWLALDDLIVDEKYQRSAGRKDSLTLIRRMAEGFCWRDFQPPTVTAGLNGHYVIIDGQHRVEAARLHPMIKKVPCYIVEAPDIKDQAKGFIAINRDRIRVHTLNVHHAALVAGDPDALHIQWICDQAKVSIPRNPVSGGLTKPRQTMAVVAIGTGLKNYGDGPLILLFAKNREKEIDMDRMVDVLGGFDMADLVIRGRVYAKDFGVKRDAAIITILTRAYNKGLRAKDKRLEEK